MKQTNNTMYIDL